MACSSVLFILHVFLLCTTQAFISPPRAPCVVGRGHDALRAQSRYQQVEEGPVDWTGEFSNVRTVSVDILKELRKLASDEDWEPLKERTRFLDLDFRKVMMGKVRKKFPEKEKNLKDDGLSIRNAISFDFIAVNKAARVEDKARALEVLDILETDVGLFLDLEKQLH